MAAQANVFSLHGGLLQVAYSTGELGSKAGLSYHDGSRQAEFTEDQLRQVSTDLGEEVSVTLLATPDLGSTTFTLIVPRVQLDLNQSADVDTVGMTAVHRFSIIPSLLHGQLDQYRVTRLRGTASLAPF
jgi:hypothetical protein